VELLTEAAPYALSAILGTLLLRQDMLLLGWLRGEYEAALYGTAFRFVEFGLFSGMIGLVALGPAIARLHGEPALLRRVYLRAVGVAAIIGTVAGALLYWFAESLIVLIFSATYAHAAPLLRILVAAIAAYLLHVPAMAVLLYARSASGILAVSVVTTALNLVLNLVLIPRFGAHGAAVAATSAIAMGACMAAALVLRMSRATAGAPAIPPAPGIGR
jgi:O-antigen/teichoic acid export membrane protein